MFAKKLLSIVPLLFLGSQFVSADDCSATYDGNNCTPSNCEAGDDGKLILVTGTGGAEGNDYVVEISGSGSTCAFYESFNGVDVCVSNKKVITENLVSGFCTDNACDTYKNCAASGICTDVTCSTARQDAAQVSCNPKNAPGTCEQGSYILSGNDLIDDDTAGTVLYTCPSTGVCNSIDTIPVGYLKNGNPTSKTAYPYLECNGETCTPIAVTAVSDCTQNKAGDLVTITEVPNICISDDLAISLNVAGTSPVKYFVKHDSSASNIFKTSENKLNNYYFMVEVSTTGTDVVLPASVEGASVKYRYASTDRRIYEKDDDNRKSSICLNSNKIVPYTKDYKNGDTRDYYTQGIAENGPLEDN